MPPTLAHYFPTLEDDFDKDDFLDHDHSKQHEAFDVSVAGVEVDKAIEDRDTTQEIVATLEDIVASLESAEPLGRWDRTFIQHSVRDVYKRTGLVIAVPSLESANDDPTVSMEGLLSGIAKLWDGIVALIRRMLRALGEFFDFLFGFSRRKEKRIKAQLAKAKEGGDKATVSSIVQKNLLKHLEDVTSVQRVLDNLATTSLAKVKPDQLVMVSPATAQVVIRNTDVVLDSSKPMVVNGQNVVAMRKKDVEELQYLKLGNVNAHLLGTMYNNGRMKLHSLDSSSVLIDHRDVTEVVWDTAYRGKEVRTRGKALAALMLSMALEAEKAVTGESKFDGTKTNITRHVAQKTQGDREAAYKIFREFVGGRDDSMAVGSQQVKVAKAGVEALAIAVFTGTRVPETDVSKQLKMKMPKYGEVSKAGDGIVSVTLLSNFNGSIDDTIKGFDKVLAVWERIQAWAISNPQAHRVVSTQVTGMMHKLFDEPFKWYAAHARSVGAMEVAVIGWGDYITHPLSKMTESVGLLDRMEK